MVLFRCLSLSIDLVVGADVEKFDGVTVKMSIDDANVTSNGEGTKPFPASFERMISKEWMRGIISEYINTIIKSMSKIIMRGDALSKMFTESF